MKNILIVTFMFLSSILFSGEIYAEDTIPTENAAPEAVYSESMPFVGADASLLPFYMNVYSAYPVFIYEKADFKGEFKNIMHQDGALIPSFCYSSSYVRYFSAYEGLLSFITSFEPDTFYYDIALSADRYSNRIYASMKKHGGRVSLDAYSYFNLYSENLNYYNTSVKVSYGSIVAQADISGDAKSLTAGYENDLMHVDAGYESGGKVPLNFYFHISKFMFIARSKFSGTGAFTDNYIMSAYYQKAGIFNIMPVIVYTDSVFASLPVSAEIAKGVFLTASGDYSPSSPYTTAGLRFCSNSYFINGGAIYRISDKFVSYRASGVIDFSFLEGGAELSYDTMLNYNVRLGVRHSFYNGEFIPGFAVEYDGERAGTFLSARLLDSELYFGSDWDLQEKTYLLSGGIQWTFAE